ncbi:MAG: hypothetical protein ACNA78_00410 [Balneolaceae bacterium]
MWTTYLISLLFFAAGVVLGGRFRIHKLSLSVSQFAAWILGLMVVFTVMMLFTRLGWLPDWLSAIAIAQLYALAGGFFLGVAGHMIRFKVDRGNVLYQHRGFLIDHLPHFLAIGLILFGLYRTSLLSDLPVTPIRLTSGLSLMMLGVAGFTLKPVPEFRSGAILFLDEEIPWKRVISWAWTEEEVLQIEYIRPAESGLPEILHLQTTIPEQDRKQVELILQSKMDEFSAERNEELFPDESSDKA